MKEDARTCKMHIRVFCTLQNRWNGVYYFAGRKTGNETVFGIKFSVDRKGIEIEDIL